MYMIIKLNIILNEIKEEYEIWVMYVYDWTSWLTNGVLNWKWTILKIMSSIYNIWLHYIEDLFLKFYCSVTHLRENI